jgi:hypothetical protein
MNGQEFRSRFSDMTVGECQKSGLLLELDDLRVRSNETNNDGKKVDIKKLAEQYRELRRLVPELNKSGYQVSLSLGEQMDFRVDIIDLERKGKIEPLIFPLPSHNDNWCHGGEPIVEEVPGETKREKGYRIECSKCHISTPTSDASSVVDNWIVSTTGIDILFRRGDIDLD